MGQESGYGLLAASCLESHQGKIKVSARAAISYVVSSTKLSGCWLNSASGHGRTQVLFSCSVSLSFQKLLRGPNYAALSPHDSIQASSINSPFC